MVQAAGRAGWVDNRAGWGEAAGRGAGQAELRGVRLLGRWRVSLSGSEVRGRPAAAGRARAAVLEANRVVLEWTGWTEDLWAGHPQRGGSPRCRSTFAPRQELEPGRSPGAAWRGSWRPGARVHAAGDGAEAGRGAGPGRIHGGAGGAGAGR